MDKLTIRLEAIKLAAGFRSQPEDVVEVAKNFEEYIIGNAEVSEYYDPNKVMNEIFNEVLKKNNAELKDIEEKLNNIRTECCLGKATEEVYLQTDDEKVE